MQDHDTLQTLIARAKNGDRAACDELLEEFHERLRARVESWSQFQLGPRVEVEELVQDAFVRAFRGLAGFTWQGEDSFFGWLCGIAKHALADSARTARRESLRRGSVEIAGVLPGSGPTASRVVRRGERFDRLRDALDALSPDYRQVLVLSRIEGLPMKEIAERMGRSLNSVKHLLARALVELKERFGDTESFHLADRRLDAEGRKHDQ